MFDGAAVADAAHAAPDASAKVLIPDAPAAVQVRAADPSQDGGKKEVVFVDISLANYQALEAAVKPGIEIEEIGGGQSGLAQMAKWAETHTGYDSISVVSPGAEATLNIGTDALTDADLSTPVRQAELAAVGSALKAGGDLMLYGSDVAAGSDGQTFIADIAAATGAKVAASDSPIGLAGNWTLDQRTGATEATAFAAPDYAGDLYIAPTEIRAAEPALNGGKLEVVFVDTTVVGYRTLEADVGPGIEVVEINGGRSGLEQMTVWAATHSGYDSISVITHGVEAAVQLGTDTLIDPILSTPVVQGELAGIGAALKSGGDLLLYACNVAEGSQGQQFINDIATETGAVVVAATHSVGAVDLDGNWTLDTSTGTGIVSATPFTGLGWDGVLGWTQLGTAFGQSTTNTTSTTEAMAIGSDGTIWVAYTYSNMIGGEYLGVEKYSGGTWAVTYATSSHASTNISGHSAPWLNIAINPVTNIPYIVYGDYFASTRNSLTVQKYVSATNSWSIVGAEGFTGSLCTGGNAYATIAFNSSGTPYVACEAGGGSTSPVVMSYNGTAWALVGSGPISSDGSSGESLAIAADGTVYLAFVDGAWNSGNTAYIQGISVMKYSSGSWSYVGSKQFTATPASASLAISSTGALYLAYGDGANSYKETVKTYSGGTWTTVGNAGFSAGVVYFSSLAFGSDGTLYIAYQDGGNSNKTYAMAYTGSGNWGAVTGATTVVSPGGTLSPSIAANSSGVYVAYQDANNSDMETVQEVSFGPTVSSIHNSANTATDVVNASSVTFTVTFSQAMTGVAANDFALTGVDASAGTIGTPTTSDGGITWTVQVTGLAGTAGTLGLNLLAAADTGTGVSAITAVSGGTALNGGLYSSGQTYTIDDTAATNSVVPAVTDSTSSGRFTVGDTFSGSTGTWTQNAAAQTLAYTYQWYYSATNSGSGTAIGGATSLTYVPSATYAHDYLRVAVTETDGTQPSSSAATSAWTLVANSAPVNTAVPVVSGAATVTNTLTATHGTFTDADNDSLTYTYQWYRSASNAVGVSAGTLISGATGSTYVLTTADAHDYVGVIVTASDGHTGSRTAASIWTTVADSAPTVTTAESTQTAAIGSAFSYQIPAGTFHDNDGDTLTYTVQQVDSGGALFNGGALPAWLSLNGSTLSGTPASGDAGTIYVKVTASDGHGGTVSDAPFLIVCASGPVLTVGSPSVTWTENLGGGGTAQTLDAGLILAAGTDASTTMTGATVSITGNYTAGDTLAIAANVLSATGITIASNSSGVLTLTGNDSVANYQAVLDAVTFTSSSTDPAANAASRTVSWQVHDQYVNCGAQTTSLTVHAVDNPPTLTADTTTVTINTASTLSAPLFSNAAASTIEASQSVSAIMLTVSNVVDGAAENLSVDGTLVALNSSSTVTSGAHSYSVDVSPSGSVSTVTITKGGNFSAVDANALINGLKYENTSASATAGDRVVTLTRITDSGSTTYGGNASTTVSVASTARVVTNDTPTVNAPATQAASSLGQALVTGVSIVDMTGGTYSATASVATGLIDVSLSGGATVSGGANDSSSVTLSGTKAQVNAALGSLKYTPESYGSTTITISVNDGGGTFLGGAKTGSTTISFTATQPVTFVPPPPPSAPVVAPPPVVVAPPQVPEPPAPSVTIIGPPPTGPADNAAIATPTAPPQAPAAPAQGPAGEGSAANPPSSAAGVPAEQVQAPVAPTPISAPAVVNVPLTGQFTAPTSGGGFQVAVMASPQGGASIDGLVAIRPDIEVPSSDGPLKITIPHDAFAHSRSDAVVVLSAARLNGQTLPSWLNFDSHSGTLTGSPPPEVKGMTVVKIIARDEKGQEATITVNIKPVSERHGTLEGEKPIKFAHHTSNRAVGKLAFTQQLKMAARNAAVRFA